MTSEEQPQQPTRSWLNWAWYSVLFVFSFLIFFLFTFPYGVVKEAVIGQLSQMTGYNIRVKDLGPSFLVGIDAEGIKLATSDNSAQYELASAEVNLSLLSLFIGRVTVDAELVGKNKGTLEARLSWGIFQLLGGKGVPSRINLNSKDFELGGLVNVYLKESSKTANELIKDLLTQIAFQANLNGRAELALAIDDPTQSTGTVDLQLKKASLDLTNPNLVIARQNFEKALIKGTLKGGKMVLDNSSAINSQELKVGLKGSSTLKNPMGNSLLDFGIDIRLEGSLKENFGVILSVVGGTDGVLNYKINGSFARPNFQGSG